MYRLIFLFLLLTQSAIAQVLGGKTTFAFLDLPVSPAQTALGSVNVSQQGNDIALSSLNPALLRPDMHSNLQLNYTSYFADVLYANVLFGYYAEKLGTTFGGGIQYIDYGSVTQTDATGSIQGSFRPRDMAIQVTASRQYLEKWHYGATLQFVQSRYQQYNSTGLVLHFGLTYEDTAHHWQAGLLAKNMGLQLSTYTPGNQEPLPFDLQVGISKKLNQLPLQLSATLHHIYQYDVRYADPGFQESSLITNGDTVKTSGQAVDKIFRHFVLAAHWEIGHYVTLTAGYNHLRRQELSDPRLRGLSGFSAGVGVVTRKIQLRYARAWYQRSAALNQFGINLPLKEWSY
ncbi:type IX secretion system protein PorQ [Chitinophaga sp.]|uniref:type IX secretion system protein PorQ n=1 Tax=Chitinophaga sp. TaxID=1869181 RepID=UPI0031D83270